MARDRRPTAFGARGVVVATILILGIAAFASLDIPVQRLLPGEGVLPTWDDLGSLRRFLAAAFSPALDYEAANLPVGTPPLWWKVLDGVHRTVAYAAMAMSLSILLGLPLGLLASATWWEHDVARDRRAWDRVGPIVFGGARLFIVLLRSVHELVWAVLFLAAMGYSNLTAVFAIAIPYAGTLAKVYSEVLDETPRDAASALRAAGARRLQIVAYGLFPQALPDMAAYTFYRFECAVRSSAILGFFGLETLGKFISSSWSEGYYGEVWTYLYSLFGIVLVFEWWSGLLRRRFVG